MTDRLIRESGVRGVVYALRGRSFRGETIEEALLNDIKKLPAVDAVEVSGATKRAVEVIVEERLRQISEWGDQSDRHPFEFMSILGEEYGELCEAVNETCFQKPKHPERGGRDAIIREAVQVAAVAVQIVEMLMGEKKE